MHAYIHTYIHTYRQTDRQIDNLFLYNSDVKSEWLLIGTLAEYSIYIQTDNICKVRKIGFTNIRGIWHNTVYYPIVPGYAWMVHKVMGQDIEHVTLVFDKKTFSSAVDHVAISRVSSIDNIVPVIHLRKSHILNKQ